MGGRRRRRGVARRREEEALKAKEEHQKQEEERKRKEEEDKKRRDEEDKLRQKEEAERKEREVELRLQQLQLLEEKDKEIHKLQEKVVALNHTFAGLQADLEGETRRGANLTDELERTQQLLEERQREADKERNSMAQEQTALSDDLNQMATKLQISSSESERRAEEIVCIKEKLGQEVDTLKTEIFQMRSDKDKDDTENTILMKLLHTELD
eukprot:gene44955-35882_t